MSGVTEWKNAVFLWVNVDEGGGYANLFERSLPASAVGGTRVIDIASERPPKYVVVGDEVTDTASDVPPKCAVVEEKKTTQEPGNPRRKREDIIGEPADAREEGGCTVDARLTELRMTWYAGGRMTPESALIRRLLKCSKSVENCDAADRTAAPSGKKPDVIKAEGSAYSVGPQQGGEGSTRNMTKGKVDVTMTTAIAAAVAEAGPSGATSALLAQAHAESVPHKQADTEENKSSKGFAAAGSESVAGEPAGVNVANANAADKLERGSSSISSTCEDVVLLFCRLPDEPYVFCGRLGYAEHWPTERPLRFVWRLLDAGKLVLQPEFGGIVEAAGIAGGREKLER